MRGDFNQIVYDAADDLWVVQSPQELYEKLDKWFTIAVQESERVRKPKVVGESREV